MKIRMMALSISMGAALAAGIASAQQPPAAPANEYTRQGDVPQPVTGTHETRAAERAAKRNDVKALNRSNGLPQTGEDWGMHPQPQTSAKGSAAENRADRSARHQEVKRLNKAGKLPVSDEAEVARTPGAKP